MPQRYPSISIRKQIYIFRCPNIANRCIILAKAHFDTAFLCFQCRIPSRDYDQTEGAHLDELVADDVLYELLLAAGEERDVCGGY